jgi:acyl-coenzyme A synthetase/AMP-(fatty) acid ligase
LVVTSQLFGTETLRIVSDDICYSEAKLFFAYGLGNNMSFPLWVGATAVLNEHRPGPATSFPIIERLRPTLYFGVPTLYAAYLQHFAKEKPDLSSLRRCVSAGEALPAEILRRWHQETGLWILDGIGSTEALHIFISNTPDDIRPGSSGRVVPGYRARILDEHTVLKSARARVVASLFPVTRRHAAIGTIPSVPRPRWSTAGSIPATPIAETPMDISTIAAAATTC